MQASVAAKKLKQGKTRRPSAPRSRVPAPSAAAPAERHQNEGDRVAAEVGYESRDRLTVTSLLHDIGKLVLLHAYPGYPAQVHRGARTPEERVHQERRELGVDHALVGGVLIRRWGLPGTIAGPIERHHNPDEDGEAAFIRLADMLAHYAHGG